MLYCTIKPLLLSLISYQYYYQKNKSIILLVAFVLSAIADTVIMIDNGGLELGLLIFTIIHVLYIIHFQKGIKFKSLSILQIFGIIINAIFTIWVHLLIR